MRAYKIDTYLPILVAAALASAVDLSGTLQALHWQDRFWSQVNLQVPPSQPRILYQPTFFIRPITETTWEARTST